MTVHPILAERFSNAFMPGTRGTWYKPDERWPTPGFSITPTVHLSFTEYDDIRFRVVTIAARTNGCNRYNPARFYRCVTRASAWRLFRLALTGSVVLMVDRLWHGTVEVHGGRAYNYQPVVHELNQDY